MVGTVPVGLAQLRNLGIEVGQGTLKHFAMIGILRRLELLQHPLPGKQEALLLPLDCELRRSQPRGRLARFGGGLGLLLLDGFTLPASRHNKNYIKRC